MQLEDQQAVVVALRNIYDATQFWNVRLIAGKRRESTFGVKFILAARSRIFCELLKSSNKEREPFLKFRRKSSKYRGFETLYFPGYEFTDFQAFITYLHCGEITVKAENVISLLHIAEGFEVKSLCSFCIDFIQRNISPDNVCYFYEKVNEYPKSNYLSSVKSIIVDFIRTNASDIFKEASFSCLSQQHMIDMITVHDALQPELLKFNAAVIWTRVRWANNHVDSPLTIQDLFLPFLSHICLDKIPIKDLIEDVRRSRVVPEQILAHACARNRSPEVSNTVSNTAPARINLTLPRKNSRKDEEEDKAMLVGIHRRPSRRTEQRKKGERECKELTRSNSARSIISHCEKPLLNESENPLFLCPPNVGYLERISTSAPCLHTVSS